MKIKHTITIYIKSRGYIKNKGIYDCRSISTELKLWHLIILKHKNKQFWNLPDISTQGFTHYPDQHKGSHVLHAPNQWLIQLCLFKRSIFHVWFRTVMEIVLIKQRQSTDRQLTDRPAAPIILKIFMTVINSRGSIVCITCHDIIHALLKTATCRHRTLRTIPELLFLRQFVFDHDSLLHAIAIKLLNKTIMKHDEIANTKSFPR